MKPHNSSSTKQQPKRPLAGYLRLTVDRDGKKIGYDVQKRAILRWAEYAGETIGEWYQDKDVTAADFAVKRPRYEAMLADVDAGMWGGIVVWRLDRLVRMTYDFEKCLNLVERSNGSIVCVDPMLNSAEELGAMFMRLLVMFGQMEINTMKARARGHRRERARAGMYNGGGPRPFGFVGAEKEEGTDKYLNVGHTGVDHVKEEVELIRWATRKILDEGWTFLDVLKDWNARTPPVLGTTGKPMDVLTLQRIMTRPRVSGQREAIIEDEETGEEREVLVPAVWKPIISEEERKRLAAKISTRASRGTKSTYLLSGRLFCECGRLVTGAIRKYKVKGELASTRTYRCKSGPADKAQGSCGQLNVIAEPVERLVVSHIVRRFEETPALIDSLNEQSETLNAELAEVSSKIKDVDERIAEISAEMRNVKGRTIATMLKVVEQLEEERRQLFDRAEHLAKMQKVPTPIGEDRVNIHRWFTETLNHTQQQAVISGLIDKVVVLKTGRSGPRFNNDRVVITPRRSDYAEA